MDLGWIYRLGQLDFWKELLAGFEGLGPVAPILLAMVESWFTPLPRVGSVGLQLAAHPGVGGGL